MILSLLRQRRNNDHVPGDDRVSDDDENDDDSNSDEDKAIANFRVTIDEKGAPTD